MRKFIFMLYIFTQTYVNNIDYEYFTFLPVVLPNAVYVCPVWDKNFTHHL